VLSVHRQIGRLAKEGAPGPSPSFTTPHILMALLLLGDKGSLGRKRIAEELGLGEGVVRTVIGRLKRHSLVKASRSGCSLTDKGRKLYESLRKRIGEFVELAGNMPWGYRYSIGVKVRGMASLLRMGLEERDAAVRAGADAAMAIAMQGGRLLMPGVSDLSEEQPSFASMIVSKFKPSDGDVVLIAGSNDKVKALYGALAAAYELLGRAGQASKTSARHR